MSELPDSLSKLEVVISTPVNRRRKNIQIAVSLVVGLVLFGAVILLAGTARLRQVAEADWRFVALAVTSGVGVTVISTIRWGYLTNALTGRRPLTFPQYFSALVSSRVLGLFLPRNASDLGVRFTALTGIGKTSAEQAATSVILDQLFDLFVILTWLGPSLLLLSGTIPAWTGWIALPMASVVAFAAMTQLSGIIRWTARTLGRIAASGPDVSRFRRLLASRSEKLDELADRPHFSRTDTTILGALTFVRYGLNAAMFWSIAAAVLPGFDFYSFLLAGAVVQLSLVAAITPGGLGIMDLGWIGVLSLAGYVASDVSAFLVAQRAFQYTFFPAMGMIGIGLTAVGARRRPLEMTDPELSTNREPG